MYKKTYEEIRVELLYLIEMQNRFDMYIQFKQRKINRDLIQLNTCHADFEEWHFENDDNEHEHLLIIYVMYNICLYYHKWIAHVAICQCIEECDECWTGRHMFRDYHGPLTFYEADMIYDEWVQDVIEKLLHYSWMYSFSDETENEITYKQMIEKKLELNALENYALRNKLHYSVEQDKRQIRKDIDDFLDNVGEALGDINRTLEGLSVDDELLCLIDRIHLYIIQLYAIYLNEND